ncbi:MAG: hypothetical protein KKE79_08285 [Actinobacteria bacterium]|nr:hypothetical protein [Actinomycetota bacterium]MBU4301777.1 hypothetical protein [Actinomycetota bacterium]MBU4490615.1 hypothetical protein [Actinomycetota bacterium]MCG2796896.1 hypothetical protein [Actinomycetes bacterium]
MAGVLKEKGMIKGYWLEPDSRRVEPEALAVTTLGGKVLQRVPYSDAAGLELRASASRRHGILVDFGREVGGFPHLVFGSGKCRRVAVQAIESMEHMVKPVLAEGAAIADPLIYLHHLKALPGRHVDLPHCGGFRYIWLYPEHPGRVTLREVWVDYTPYLTTDKDACGYFLSSDDLLNRAWFAGLHTLEMCTVDPALGGIHGKHRIGEGEWVLVDGARRDRLIWTADISPMAVATYVSNNNTRAVRDSLLSLVAHQEKNGYIPACSPGPLTGRIAGSFFGDYVAWWVVTLYQYYTHTGDRETVGELFPAIKRALHYLHSQCSRGLFRQTPFNMMEWCFTVFRLGKPMYTNVMYYWALNSASFLAHEIGEEDVSIGYVSRAYRLSEAIERELFDEELGVFIDTTADRGRVPQDGNSLAIISSLVSEPDVAKSILHRFRESLWEEWGSTNVDVPYYRLTPGLQPHNKRVIPFMNNYEALARFISGDDQGALELVRRCWGTMVQSEPGTTFWEWMGRTGGVDGRLCSLCHGWSSGVVSLLSKFVLGIRPVGVGYGRYRVDPCLVDLEWVEGRVPVEGGFVEVRAEKKKKGGVEVNARAPRGIEIEGITGGS